VGGREKRRREAGGGWRKEERGEIAVGDRKSTTESTRSCDMLRVGSKDFSHFLFSFYIDQPTT
jgi:hypothetical protein